MQNYLVFQSVFKYFKAPIAKIIGNYRKIIENLKGKTF